MKHVYSIVVFLIMMPALAAQGQNPILFVTQVPTSGFTSVTQTFSNHVPSMNNAPRGGDLMILYPDGTLRNVTREAGYGDSNEIQGKNSIAVRQPCVHWSGKKALFSMVIGAPTKIWEIFETKWQIYEIEGLGKDEQLKITKLPHQPEMYNNISPIYGSDDNIIFTSDMPITKKSYHYPPLDEYENAQVVSGLWKLDIGTGEVTLLQHSPSGSFYPSIDSYGRIIFTRWDHLQRDQQADLDRSGQPYGTFNYESEDSLAQPLQSRAEVFPEPRTKNNPDFNPLFSPHTFNQFFPWEINQDGTEEETINHVGRHEWGGTYTEPSYPADKNLRYIIRKNWVKNSYSLRGDSGPFQIKEDPNNQGIFYAAVSPEFAHETSGQLIRFSGKLHENPEEMIINEITHSSTAGSVELGQTANAHHSGRYRDPLPLTNGTLLAVHSESKNPNGNNGTSSQPKIRYNFRIKTLRQEIIDGKQLYVADKPLTSGIVRGVKYYDGNDYFIAQNDTLWELEPVEVTARTVPPMKKETTLSSSESDVFSEIGVDEQIFRKWMNDNNLGLIVSRNVVTRDRNDDNQPFNLRVPNGVEHIVNDGTVYDVEYMQIFQADLIRGQGGAGGHTTPNPGRRVLPQVLHHEQSLLMNNDKNNKVKGSVKIASDGSMAAIVPAHRALSWQLTDGKGTPVVRGRYWVTVQSGEIRVCASCHGINTVDQLGLSKPMHKPEALRQLLQHWKTQVISGHSDEFTDDKKILTISPNPAENSVNIICSIPENDNIIAVDVYNVFSHKVYSLTLNDNPKNSSIPLTLQNYSDGVYFIQVRTQKNYLLSEKLIIKHN
ncbi:MAG: T9SS type A sorting domain-containing protein [Ignavibacteria bacterium]|nr:T9SS type A sorting domain-containing protein [Ignavibacteria bacterium]